MTGPLAGIRVIDLSQNAPGPFCTMLLGDLGADVIHIVNPARGGDFGYIPTDDPFMATRYQRHDALMRNKRSLALNLKDPRGRDLLVQLVDGADVFVEEMRPGAAARLGVDYDTLAARNPGLIYCSVSGYGQTGPYRHLAGHDINYVAVSGALDLIRDRAGEPVIPQNLLSDYAGGGMMAVVGVMGAIIARHKTGRGQHVDVSMTDSVLTLLTQLFAVWFGGAAPDTWRGTLSGQMPHFRCYRCADGKYIAVGPLEARFARQLLTEIGLPELFDQLHDRRQWPAISQALAGRFAQKPRDAWFEQLRGQDVCLSKVNDLTEVEHDPQVRARQMIVEAFGVKQVGVSPKFSDTPGSIRSAPASVGEHSAEILTELGLSEAGIETLRRGKVTL